MTIEITSDFTFSSSQINQLLDIHNLRQKFGTGYSKNILRCPILGTVLGTLVLYSQPIHIKNNSFCVNGCPNDAWLALKKGHQLTKLQALLIYVHHPSNISVHTHPHYTLGHSGDQTNYLYITSIALYK